MSTISQLRIIVTGLVGLYPVGGVAWDYLQYIIGLSRLGYDVYYYEDTWSWPYHPTEKTYTAHGEYSAKYIADFFQTYYPQLKNCWHYVHLHDTCFGIGRQRFAEVAKTADIFINLSGACFIPDELSSDCVKVFIDTDPGYNQIMLSEKFAWSENVERWCEGVRSHDVFFTYAENIHSPDCLIPKLGFDWHTTRMPIVLDLWSQISEGSSEQSPWTTIMTWNAFKGKLLYKGAEYTSKGTEFEKIIELPSRAGSPLKIAVGGVKAPLDRLKEYGWDVVDGPSATITSQQYQDYIAQSRGEISIAKNVYVAMKSGWFSCRSACYLAAGKPIVVQDTGFSNIIPAGKGILSFTDQEEAVSSIHEAEVNYRMHAATALAIAHEYFDSDNVLAVLINSIKKI